MDNGYWSMYRNDKRIASPFYHDLHIAQLSVLYKFTKKNCYKFYADKFKYYKTKWWNRKRAFIKKSFQKLFERKEKL